jgi:translation elongation factor EF-Tu-like GTPase
MFRLVVEDIFSIEGRGTVFTGSVEGRVRVGDSILVQTPTRRIRTSVAGLESLRNMVPAAESGEDIGVLCPAVHDASLSGCYV